MLIGRALRLARTLGAGSVLVYAMLGVVALLVLPPGPVNVPGRPGVVAVVWTLVAVLPAIAGATALSRVGDSEVISARGFPVVCLALLGWSTLAAAPLAALALATARPEVVRNLALLGAVAIILTRLVGLRSCWIAVVLYAGASWLLGVDQRHEVALWAVPMMPWNTVVSLAVTGGCAAVALALLPMRTPAVRRA